MGRGVGWDEVSEVSEVKRDVSIHVFFFLGWGERGEVARYLSCFLLNFHFGWMLGSLV